MIAIIKKSNYDENSDLTYQEYMDFRKIYEKAGTMAVELIFYAFSKYGPILNNEDINVIINLLPRETDFKTWDMEKYKNEIAELQKHLDQRGKIAVNYHSILKDDDKYVNNVKNLFPYYSEYINNPE
jgi:hypothetical protein